MSNIWVLVMKSSSQDEAQMHSEQGNNLRGFPANERAPFFKLSTPVCGIGPNLTLISTSGSISKTLNPDAFVSGNQALFLARFSSSHPPLRHEARIEIHNP